MATRHSSNDENKLIYGNGTYYIGEVSSGRRNGFGILYEHDGKKLVESKWENDQPEGDAIFYNYWEAPKDESTMVLTHHFLDRPDWVKFSGVVVGGKKHGLGVLTFLNGDKFTGEFVN